MERLVSLGASVNKKNRENYTALHFGKLKLIYAQSQILVAFIKYIHQNVKHFRRDTAPLD
jgi:hypothetical protein